MADIFVSYASEDRSRIQHLVGELESAGFSVWWDQDLRGGSRFSKNIETELTSATVVIVAWSENAVTSRWVADEADLALETGNLLPIAFDGTRAPLGFRQLQTIEFLDWQGGHSDCLDDLLSALNHHLNAGQRRPNHGLELPATANIKSDASVAVLPFANLSADPEQELFADGIVEDLITAISRFPWLFVVSRSTTFSYKGRRAQAQQVQEELGVRYIVEGSVRVSRLRLRVSVQLVDAINDRHLWAETFDRPTGDIFDVQDEICQYVTGALIPALSKAEREHFARAQHPDLSAWVSFQRGLAQYYRPFNPEGHAAARRYFDQAVELDPNFAEAQAMIAMMGVYSINSGQTSYTQSREQILQEAKHAAEKAVQLDDCNAMAHVALGRVSEVFGNFELAISELETAIGLNPNLATAHYELGFVLDNYGRLEESIASIDRAIRLSPNDPSRWNFYLVKGIALGGLGECDKAYQCYQESLRLRPGALWPQLGLVYLHMQKGETEMAAELCRKIKEQNPDWTIGRMRSSNDHAPSEHIKKFYDDIAAAWQLSES